ncbi:MAG: hypothetical protein AB1491_05120 [Thermodesulfobacteriota bacterium]
MLDFFLRLQASVYIQIIILVLLLAYFFGHRRDPRHLISGLSLFRTIILILIFLYFLWNWSSEIPPSLRNVSVLGMFIINLYMFWNVILTRLERPYRDALEACGQEPEKPANYQQLWRSAKRFFYVRYFLDALFSGGSPTRFLHSITSEQVRHDVKNIFSQRGVKKPLISCQTEMAFLKNRLSQEESLPAEFKEVMTKAIDQFQQHPWIEEQVNEFLALALEDPVRLYSPEWAARMEKADRPAPGAPPGS